MKRFLIVDDDSRIRELCKIILSRSYENAIIDQAINGLEALGKVAAENYSAIVCDVEMPVLNGPGFYKRLKDAHPTMACRIVFISGNFNNQTISFLEEEGRQYLSKPFTKREFLGLVNSVL